MFSPSDRAWVVLDMNQPVSGGRDQPERALSVTRMAAAQRQAEQSGWRPTAGESSSLRPQLEAGKTGPSSTNNNLSRC